MKAFAALVASLSRMTRDDVSAELLSATTYGGHDPLPPLFAAHLLLDGREYVLTLVPTDLGDRGVALEENFEPNEWKEGDGEKGVL